MNSTQPLASQLQIAALVVVPYATAVLHLGSAPVTIGPDTVVGDFTECNFTGYAAKTFTTGFAPYIDSQGGVTFSLPAVQFNVTTATPIVGNSVWNWWLVDSTSNLLACGQWTNPIQMNQVGNSIPFQFFANLPAQLVEPESGDYT